MKKFLDDNFLLKNNTAEKLYHEYAKQMPIIDYHCHLSPQEIYENKRFKNITEAWLYGDHYKWRVMRANGAEEKYVTGGDGASDYDRFLAWAKTVPMTIGNPLYHWSHLELQRFFGVYDLINEKNAPAIWEKVNAQLGGEGFAARDLITKSGVKVVCTTDDPTDSLEYHIKIKDIVGFDCKVLPSFRPDKGLEINRSTFLPWVEKLGEVAGGKISSYDELLTALESRVRFFHSVGGRVSDHALDYVAYAETTQADAAAIFDKALQGGTVSLEEEKQYKTYTLTFLGKLYAELGWAMQFHINAHRNNNTRMFGKLGPDTGYDSINDSLIAQPLVRLLDALDAEDALPKTILYSLNPKDNYVLGTIIGSYQGGGVAGKIQFGSAWWFNDTLDGMLDQMKALANLGLLSRFVGMLTDSRSFLSYTRHEYFRRLLCNLIGEWVENGEAPDDMELLGGIVQAISYNNAKEYFDFGL
ncbi:glucuronate isomerase [Paenibacillus allorhizosphaerae]|uniref:Uronate isomerase n=1 Tax=Paenibacillus allorhizosphaerae TaxID=2849866 RepID=A0ABM8VHR7_9BACL|nr:glucuronate isomerase [Paenibacillus allorhizosphaerae]CAG7642848.1 Uronate isomerase [Paenibacillus allorhizosphaerae]